MKTFYMTGNADTTLQAGKTPPINSGAPFARGNRAAAIICGEAGLWL